MAIPKEPRQLMINIMYLVLTALLALNVSAEIFNAFKVVDKSIVKSNRSLDESNNKLPEAIRDGAKKKESLATYAERIEPTQQISKDLSIYIDDLITKMIDETGGYLEDSETGKISDELKGKKNKDITTRYLVEGGKGEELKQKILQSKKEFLAIFDETDVQQYAGDVAVGIDDKTWKEYKKKSWSEMNFNHMPLQAAIPILRKYQNDAKNTESTVLNYLANKVGTTTDVVLDKFTVVSAPEKSYVIKGEQFKTDVFLSAFAGADSKTGISISVNGRPMSVNADGIASYSAAATTIGKKQYNATISVRNPVTDEVNTYKKDFEYEVGERSVAVSAMKMNVFYIGVDNPVSVTAAGVPSNQVKVSMGGSGGGSIKPSGGNYMVRVSTPTSPGQFATINVTAPGLNEKREFRVKRIPDPVARLTKSAGGTMGSGEFKAQLGLGAYLDNFDFDARCEIQGYKLVHVPTRQDASEAINGGARYNSESQRMIAKAKPGDVYYFDNVKAKCPGDAAGRSINSLVFKIK